MTLVTSEPAAMPVVELQDVDILWEVNWKISQTKVVWSLLAFPTRQLLMFEPSNFVSREYETLNCTHAAYTQILVSWDRSILSNRYPGTWVNRSTEQTNWYHETTAFCRGDVLAFESTDLQSRHTDTRVNRSTEQRYTWVNVWTGDILVPRVTSFNTQQNTEEMNKMVA